MVERHYRNTKREKTRKKLETLCWNWILFSNKYAHIDIHIGLNVCVALLVLKRKMIWS